MIPREKTASSPSDTRCNGAAAVDCTSFPLCLRALYCGFESRTFSGFCRCNKEQAAPSGTSWNLAVKQSSALWCLHCDSRSINFLSTVMGVSWDGSDPSSLVRLLGLEDEGNDAYHCILASIFSLRKDSLQPPTRL